MKKEEIINIVNIAIKDGLNMSLEPAVKKIVNGKIDGITAHLKEQDAMLADLKVLLEEKKFRGELWKLLKRVFTGIVSLLSGYLIIKNILK